MRINIYTTEGMDEVSSQIPLLIEWRAHIEPVATSDALVKNVDFAPSLLDASRR